MPRPISHLVEFNQRFNDDDRGGPWTIEGRQYVLDEIWRPARGFRAWPKPGKTKPCAACLGIAGCIIDDPDEASPAGHDESGGCAGLSAIPVVITAPNLPRRSGKTSALFGLGLATIFLESYKRIAYIASAEDQAEELVKQKLRPKIEKHELLSSRCKITANKIEVPGKHSFIEILPASHSSITGRNYTDIYADEVRDVQARVIAALIPSMFDSHGVECPYGHGHWQVIDRGPKPPLLCPSCGNRNVRWYGRLLLASASGIREDNAEKDWYDTFVTKRTEKPHPAVHIFRTDKKINPSVSAEIIGYVSEAFADVPALSEYLAVETGNTSMRRGEVFLTKTEVEEVKDYSLRDTPGSSKAAIAFIDTSKTGDKTSLVVVVDDSEAGGIAFEKLLVAHIKVWDPADPADCPSGIVDPARIEAHLDLVMPRFSALLSGKVDTRVMPWAKILVAKLRKEKQWGKRWDGFEGNALADSAMYLELLDRVKGKTIRIFPHAELEAELLALRKTDLSRGGIKVYDAGSGKDGRNRKVGGIHRDIAMSLAACCLRAAELRLEMPQSMSTIEDLDRELDELMPKSIMGGLVRGGF